MFVLIENHTDDFDTYCRLRGAFKSMDKAHETMEDLYDTAKKRNAEYEIFDAWIWPGAAHIDWEGIPDRFEWNIFEAKCE